MSLKPVLLALNELEATSSRKEKERLVEKFINEVEHFRKVAAYALDPYKQFNILTVEKREHDGSTPIQIFNFLDILSTRAGASALDRAHLSRMSSIDEETVEVVRRIINKDLRCGVGIKTAQKFIPSVVDYGVMKPQTDKKTLHSDFEKFLELAGGFDGVNLSTKVDGVRICNCVVHENEEVEYFSTNGKKYKNFHCFNETMVWLARRFVDSRDDESFPVNFDGEVISYDGNFQSVVTQTQREYDVDTSNLRFLVWSVVCDGPFYWRYHFIEENLPIVASPVTEQDVIGEGAKGNVFCLHHNFQHGFRSWKEIEMLARRMISTGEEGIILKTNTHWHEYKRSREWFRVKALYLEGEGVEADLRVVGWEKGTGKYKEMLGALLCDYNGQMVRVGGGFTEAQRKEFTQRQPRWITINADSETNDKSLRFPQFVREREEK